MAFIHFDTATTHVTGVSDTDEKVSSTDQKVEMPGVNAGDMVWPSFPSGALGADRSSLILTLSPLTFGLRSDIGELQGDIITTMGELDECFEMRRQLLLDRMLNGEIVATAFSQLQSDFTAIQTKLQGK